MTTRRAGRSTIRRALAAVVLAAAPISALVAAQPATAATTTGRHTAWMAPATGPTHAVAPHLAATSGYDMVGSDGGVFVFGSTGGFFGSLPGLGITVDIIVGAVATRAAT